MTLNPQLSALHKVGQSVWYDNLSRDVLRSGALQKFIDSGLLGLTSNPTIFKKAIADSNDYDTDIKALSSRGLNTEQLCEELMMQDVAAAADLLKPIFTRSNGEDGYASIEVSPFLARDSKGTIEAAKRLWTKLNRPNVMIKIPGTQECLPAIRAALEAGINVNVTLLFSLQNYEAVVEQYISALETRMAKGEKIDHVASVASFFVSRVDAICEKYFAEQVKEGRAKAEDIKSFFGKVGVANARVTYDRFKELFWAPRFEKLRAKGAKVQRPLWASTGTKNPDLNPLLYVEELAGAHTVNTMPPATLDILLKGGKVRNALDEKSGDTKEVFDHLKRLGIPFDKLMKDLQDQGVELFADSYKDLLASISKKQASVATAHPA